MHTQLVHLSILPFLVTVICSSRCIWSYGKYNVTTLTISGTTTIYLLLPRLIGFTFSLDDGNITLTFDQEVLANTIDDTKLTIQNHMTAPNASYTYQNGAPINLQPTVINLFLMKWKLMA